MKGWILLTLQKNSSDENTTSFFLASGSPTVTFNPTVEMLSKIQADVDTAFHALDQCLTDEIAKITVRRDHVLEDVLAAYRNDSHLCSKRLEVEFCDEEGADFGGLTRDMFSMFWTEAIAVYFSGESAVVPKLPLHKQRALRGDYTILGRILAHTVALVQAIPPRLTNLFVAFNL
ncbi:uncharacterized protein LOC117123009 [Anneissia japonica]|uniref:uncharacterized protein LOC117123009 n=1 Tax=Anneissia japonica TaxID=1529436 RepID=UPI001425A903|nr:uncharacterized protein LOC117123009 [Anneissia japonica]